MHQLVQFTLVLTHVITVRANFDNHSFQHAQEIYNNAQIHRVKGKVPATSPRGWMNGTACSPHACSVLTPVLASVRIMPAKPSMAALQQQQQQQQQQVEHNCQQSI
jgi:hypothetical protein